MDLWLRDLLGEYRTGLEEIYGPRLRGVFLFGSYARGEAMEGSDVDLLIVLDDLADYYQEIRRTSRLNAQLSLRHRASVSRVFASSRMWEALENPTLKNAHQDAIAA